MNETTITKKKSVYQCAQLHHRKRFL